MIGSTPPDRAGRSPPPTKGPRAVVGGAPGKIGLLAVWGEKTGYRSNLVGVARSLRGVPDDPMTVTAPDTASRVLRDAWNHAYGLHPDATAYRDAIRAVEEVACLLSYGSTSRSGRGR